MPNDTTIQPISDDQELAKVLAGVSQENEAAASEEPAVVPTPVIPGAVLPSAAPAAKPSSSDDSSAMPTPSAMPEPTLPEPVEESTPSLSMPELSSDDSSTPAPSGELDSIKKEALGELRPLVDKLDVNPEEKFDTYLLLLRSTDDKELIAPAHEAAKAIGDEARRAQALLDIIKEIDFLSQNQQ